MDLVKVIRKDCIRSVLTQIPKQLLGKNVFNVYDVGYSVIL